MCIRDSTRTLQHRLTRAQPGAQGATQVAAQSRRSRQRPAAPLAASADYRVATRAGADDLITPASPSVSGRVPTRRRCDRNSSWTLLLSQGDGDEFLVEAAGEVALECAHGFAGGLAFALAALEVGACWLVVACADAG